MKFNIGFIPTLFLLIPVIFACFKTPADKPELEDENIIVFIAKCVGRFGCIGYMCLAIGDYEVGFSSKLLFKQAAFHNMGCCCTARYRTLLGALDKAI